MKSSSFIERAAEWAERKGFKSVKANCEDYQTPKRFARREEEITVTPDVTGMKNGRKSYIEVAIKTEDNRRNISKWKLLSALARRTGGKLILLAPRGHKAFAERQLNKHFLMAELISI